MIIFIPDNILQQMAACDLSAPVNVMVTFEDSNEDISLSQEIKEELITLVNSDSFRTEAPSLTLEKKIEDDDEKLSNNRKENHGMILEDTNNIETNSRSKSLKRKLESPPKTASKQINKNNIVTHDLHNLVGSERTTKYTTTNNDNNILLSNENNKKVKEGDREINYVPNLLNTVSKHISLIMEAFYCFTRLNNSTCDQNLVREAMNHFIQLKTHLFSLSYCTVSDIILPHVNDPKFIQKFIYNTTAIANEKSPCSYQQIESLFTDMVDWTKGKQKYLNILPGYLGAQHNSNQNNVILKQHLMKPPLFPKLPPDLNIAASKPVPPPLYVNRNAQSYQFHSHTVPAKPYPPPLDLNRNHQSHHPTFHTVPSKLNPINGNAQSNQPLSYTTPAKPRPPTIYTNRNTKSHQTHFDTVPLKTKSPPILYVNRNTQNNESLSDTVLSTPNPPPINRYAQNNQAKSYTMPYKPDPPYINKKIQKNLAESGPCAHYPSDLNGNTQKSQQCIFSSGPSGRNINISVNPSLLNHQNEMSTDNSTKTVNHDYQPGFSRENNISQHEKSYVPQCNNSNTLPPVTIYSNNYVTYIPDVNINNILVQNQPDTMPYNYENRVPVPTEQNYLPPPVYTEKAHNEPRSPQNQHEPTRSTSTDSGFMSPLNFGTTEPMVIFYFNH